jgi:hypothetical protein
MQAVTTPAFHVLNQFVLLCAAGTSYGEIMIGGLITACLSRDART